MTVEPEIDIPAAYGRDSLEYTGEPVMHLIVWQKNEKDPQEWKETRDIYSSFFYEKTELPLVEGESILSVTDLNTMVNHQLGLTFTVEYDGDIKGEYDIMNTGRIYYSGNSDIVPASWGGSSKYKTEFDSTFSGNGSVTFNLNNPVLDYHLASNEYKSSKYYVNDWMEGKLFRSVFDEKQFFDLQPLHDAYPDAPEMLSEYERSITRTCMTLHAMHPTKPDIIVATAELEIKTYSFWQMEKPSNEIYDAFQTSGIPNNVYSEITVLSYEQSDSFLWE